MNRSVFFVCLIALSCLPVCAQKVIYNMDVHPEWGNFSEVVDVWTRYLQAESDSVASVYWNPGEVAKYGYRNYNLINPEYQPVFHKIIKYHHAQILRITEEDGLYKITTQFYYPRHDTMQTLCIMNVYVQDKGDGFKLYNALPINLAKNWNTRTTGYLKYYYPKSHEFNEGQARKQNDFITRLLPEIFGCRPDTVHYYFADTQRELNDLKGFEYNIGESGTLKPTGKAAPGNIVYTTGTGEYYPHELVHIFVDPLFPPKHLWASEGLATYLGGSRGKELQWHIERTHAYLQEHPEVDLNNMLELRTLDEYTDYRYVLGGTIIRLIHEKEDWKGVKEFLREVPDEEAYYKAVRHHLGWKRDSLDKELRASLRELAVRK